MRYDRLESNIIDVIEEQQIKLGFMEETIRLYYPQESLVTMLDTDESLESIRKGITGFKAAVRDRLGEIRVTRSEERFCFIIPPVGAVFVHEHAKDNEFLKAFIKQIEVHGCTIEDLVEVCKRFSDKVICQEETHGEFDYVLYFEDGEPDDYRYCVKSHGAHMIYHRFSEVDYLGFGF